MQHTVAIKLAAALTVTATAFAAGGVLGSAAAPAPTPASRATMAQPHRAAPKAAVVAVAPNARVAALIGQSGVLLMNKGLAKVTHPGTGEYCLKPVTTVKAAGRSVPSLDIEFGYSSGSDFMLAWAWRSGNCPSGTWDILTYSRNLGTLIPSDDVAFSIIVP